MSRRFFFKSIYGEWFRGRNRGKIEVVEVHQNRSHCLWRSKKIIKWTLLGTRRIRGGFRPIASQSASIPPLILLVPSQRSFYYYFFLGRVQEEGRRRNTSKRPPHLSKILWPRDQINLFRIDIKIFCEILAISNWLVRLTCLRHPPLHYINGW